MVGLHLIGVALALIAALGSAIVSLIIRIGTENGDISDAVLITALVNTVILLPIVAVLYFPDYGLTPKSSLSFIAAGLAGTVLGRGFKYASIRKIGASRTEPIVASWVLVSTILGVILLNETLTLIHGLGIMLVVGGVVLIAVETSQGNPDNLSRRELLAGLIIPILGAVALGWEPIFANFGLNEATPAPVGLLVKTAAASLGLLAYLRWRGALPTRITYRSNDFRMFVIAGVVSTVSLLSYYLALGLVPVNVVVPIMATNTMLVVVLSIIFMPRRLEKVSWHLLLAAMIVVGGVVLISVYG